MFIIFFIYFLMLLFQNAVMDTGRCVWMGGRKVAVCADVGALSKTC